MSEKKKRKGDSQRACVENGECRPPHQGSKDTRHYCKGRIGVEHQWRWMRCTDIPNESWYHKRRDRTVHNERIVCVVCWKLDYRTRERCACCDAILSQSLVPSWMSVPNETSGQFGTSTR